jgi:hypothetical protein
VAPGGAKRCVMNEEDKKKKEVKYPVGEEKLRIGGIRNFQEFQIDKQRELIEDLIIELNKKAEADKKEAERFETLLAKLCDEFIHLQNVLQIKSGLIGVALADAGDTD